MGNLFSNKKTTRVTEQDKAVLVSSLWYSTTHFYVKRINVHVISNNIYFDLATETTKR
jgi:hypothetical protein